MAHGNDLLSQRYYFLKLPKNWLKSNARVKKMRKERSIGDKGVIIYLKMMLLSTSMSATIIYEGLEETIEEELALKLDEKLENVKKVVDFLIKSSLIERKDNGDLLLVEVQGMVGSETYGNVIRKNNKNKGLAKSKPNSNPMLTIKEKEIDIEIEEDIEIEKEIDNKENKLNKNTPIGDINNDSLLDDNSIDEDDEGGDDDDLPF